jgi:hypothetical protein
MGDPAPERSLIAPVQAATARPPPFEKDFHSAWALLRGRHYYRDNWFERDVRRSS